MFFSFSHQNQHFEQQKNLKKFIKKFPILWKFFTWSKDRLINLSRLIDVLMMMILFHVWPEQTYRFSTRKLLPRKKNRFSKESKPIIPYELLQSKSSNIPMMKEVNVIAKGSNFNLNNIKKLNGPVFIVSHWGPLKIDSKGNLIAEKYTQKYRSLVYGQSKKSGDVNVPIEGQNQEEFKNKNIIYANSDKKEVTEMLKKNGHNVICVIPFVTNKDGNHQTIRNENDESLIFNPINYFQCECISVVEKIYKPPILEPNPSWAPTGSFLQILCALSFFAEKINVYGWDFYLNSSPQKMGYWKLFFKMYRFEKDLLRSKNFFESALINFYYGYQFSKLPNINIQGYMGELSKHQKLIKRIERVLFN